MAGLHRCSPPVPGAAGQPALPGMRRAARVCTFVRINTVGVIQVHHQRGSEQHRLKWLEKGS